LAVRPAQALETCARRYGECFTLRPPVGYPVVLFSHPDAVREIFTGDVDELRGGESNDVLRPLLGGNSLLVLDGSRHTRERRLLLPPFHGRRLSEYGAVIAEVADAAIAGWPAGCAISMQGEMQAITLEVIFRVVFGLAGGRAHAHLRRLLARLLRIAANPLLLWQPMQRDLGRLTPWAGFARVKEEIAALLCAEIAARRATAAAAADVLSMLVAARDENGEAMSDAEVCDEMLTILVAGHETTATALSWTLQRLLSTPSVLERLRREVDAVPRDDPHALASLPYLDAVLKETLRLNPVIPDVGRVLSRPHRIQGRDLPAGVAAAACIYLTQRRADVWPDPLRFAPERFLDKRPSPYEFFPFGGGSRRCIGMAFALFEMKIILAHLLRRLDLALAPGYRARVVRRSITLAPSRGTPVVIGGPPVASRAPEVVVRS